MSPVGGCRLLGPGEGLSGDLRLGRPTVKLGAALSAQVGVVEGKLSPGGGFQVPHWHEDLDDVFYVIEGEIEFLLDGQWRRAVAGNTLFVPAGTVHALRNANDSRRASW